MVTETKKKKRRKNSFILNIFKDLFRKKPLGAIGLVIFLIILLTGIFAGVLAPYPRDETHAAYSLKAPSSKFILGTDLIGRDVLSRIMYGSRVSLIAGIAGSSIATIIALLIGLPSGYIGGKYDIIIQRLVDAFNSFPALFLYLTIMSMLGRGLFQVILVLGVSEGFHHSNIIRGAVMGVKENTYVYAAKSIGCSSWRILYKHILPHVMGTVIIIFSTLVGSICISEATLSFLGFGIAPPTPSWGGMLSEQGRQYMIAAPWLATWPGVALSITVFSLNMLGDAIRDILDPRLKGGVGSYRISKKIKKIDI